MDFFNTFLSVIDLSKLRTQEVSTIVLHKHNGLSI